MERAELAEELAHPAPEEDRRTLPWGAEKSCSLRACAWLFTQKTVEATFSLINRGPQFSTLHPQGQDFLFGCGAGKMVQGTCCQA